MASNGRPTELIGVSFKLPRPVFAQLELIRDRIRKTKPEATLESVIGMVFSYGLRELQFIGDEADRHEEPIG